MSTRSYFPCRSRRSHNDCSVTLAAICSAVRVGVTVRKRSRGRVSVLSAMDQASMSMRAACIENDQMDQLVPSNFSIEEAIDLKSDMTSARCAVKSGE